VARLKVGSSTTYDEEKIKMFLVENGVSIDIVNSALEAGKNVRKYEYVEYRLT
jgi:hypothetical protein